MKSRSIDPLRLDIQAFARDGVSVEGFALVSQLPRLLSSLFAPRSAADDDRVAWNAQGEIRKPNSLNPQTWLHLRAHADVDLECQRCLAAVRVPLNVDREFRFVSGEDAAAELDAEQDEDVLALERTFNLVQLVEDELLLALPIVPRHDVCPEPLRMHVDADGPDGVEAPHAFALLATLKTKPPRAS